MTDRLQNMMYFLEEIASKKIKVTEEEPIYEWAAGNIDDAYEVGEEDGRIKLAKELLESFFGFN
jgi:hypothetical protein